MTSLHTNLGQANFVLYFAEFQIRKAMGRSGRVFGGSRNRLSLMSYFGHSLWKPCAASKYP
jgi:hypothetical protein